MTAFDRVSTGRDFVTASPMPAVTGPAGNQPQAGDCLVMGWAFWETTGAAGSVFNILDGNDANGLLVAQVKLSAGQSIRDTTGALGLYFRTGVFVQVLSGTVAGSIWGVDL